MNVSPGLALHFPKPEYIELWLWAALAYFILRFYQHLSVRADRIESYFGYMKAEQIAESILMRRILRDKPEYREKMKRSVDLVKGPLDQSCWQYAAMWLHWREGDEKASLKFGDSDYVFRFQGWRLWYVKRLGEVIDVCKRPTFTEHYLPLLLPYACLAFQVIEHPLMHY